MLFAVSDTVWLALIGIVAMIVKEGLDQYRSSKANKERTAQTAKIDKVSTDLVTTRDHINSKMDALVKATAGEASAIGKAEGVQQEQTRVITGGQQTIDAAKELLEHAADTAAALIATANEEAKNTLREAKDAAKEMLSDAKNAAKEIVAVQRQPGSEGPLKAAAEATTKAATAVTDAVVKISGIVDQSAPKPSPGKKV